MAFDATDRTGITAVFLQVVLGPTIVQTECYDRKKGAMEWQVMETPYLPHRLVLHDLLIQFISRILKESWLEEYPCRPIDVWFGWQPSPTSRFLGEAGFESLIPWRSIDRRVGGPRRSPQFEPRILVGWVRVSKGGLDWRGSS